MQYFFKQLASRVGAEQNSMLHEQQERPFASPPAAPRLFSNFWEEYSRVSKLSSSLCQPHHRAARQTPIEVETVFDSKLNAIIWLLGNPFGPIESGRATAVAGSAAA